MTKLLKDDPRRESLAKKLEVTEIREPDKKNIVKVEQTVETRQGIQFLIFNFIVFAWIYLMWQG